MANTLAGSNVGFEKITTTNAKAIYIAFIDDTPEGILNTNRAFYLSPQLLDKLNDANVNGVRFFFGLTLNNQINLIVHRAFASDFSGVAANFNVVDKEYVILEGLADQPTDFLSNNGLLDPKRKSLIKRFQVKNISRNKAYFIHKELIKKICKKANPTDTEKGLKILIGWNRSNGKMHLIGIRANDSSERMTGNRNYATLADNLGGPSNTRPCPPYGGCNP